MMEVDNIISIFEENGFQYIGEGESTVRLAKKNISPQEIVSIVVDTDITPQLEGLENIPGMLAIIDEIRAAESLC
ncbi:MAG: hypothetical protein IJT54_10065 [Candidatus Methanomethylophilaceae archaeon]|nr:hypothetical protein [Candidatus Methanomethylophilaceae archaeon]